MASYFTPLKISNLDSYVSEAIEAIVYAAHVYGGYSRILNFSFDGYGKSEVISLRDAIANVPNILFVWSAGNDTVNVNIRPLIANGSMNLDNLIAVGAIDRYGDKPICQIIPLQVIMFTYLHQEYRVGLRLCLDRMIDQRCVLEIIA